MSSATPTTAWATLRNQSRRLEEETDVLFSRYSALASESVSSVDETVESSIRDSLMRRGQIVESLSISLDSDSGASAAKTHQLARSREILADHEREFARLKANLQQSRNHANLLSSVRQDIKYEPKVKSSTSDQFLREHESISSSHRMTDSILAQAYETRDEFGRQRAALSRMNMRLLNSASSIPGLNKIIGKINTRKKRDSVILAVIISMCICVFLFWG
ncbi:Golgi SNAP receptor complex member 1 [Neolecta irregularis DAH-3]|uniref:Golgi SNAP receptor complex member 1 n=1 Tax=Neolecta irregularis (strain DAH-3) TaxID=1198029 RepID=A0A1U7LTG0_NEOID|nr:Golgi SNAP receptor complex member 1 [Neolecta irregularis DAH-3]|eukprot:OLL25832.1 Golgi SNAP receptor complex member 1 [Neolecta irregularis DAH-3]